MTEHLYEICKIPNFDVEKTPNLLWIGGAVGIRLSDRDCFELRKDESLAWQAAILWESFSNPFQSQLVWKEANAVLFGAHNEIYALDIHTGAEMFHERVGSYFGSFKIEPFQHMLLVLTGSEILSFDRYFQKIWSTHGLAVDGVVCQEIGETFLTVAAEMDPPSGWHRVKIDLQTGAELARQSMPPS